jgi:hypothetical protein
VARRPTKPAGKAGGRSRPPQRPGRDYAAEYARRKASGIARGKSLQQARGHKQAEHIVRAEHERAKRGGLTKAEEQRIANFAASQARAGKRRVGVERSFLRIAREQGYDAFREVRDRLKAINKDKRETERREAGKTDQRSFERRLRDAQRRQAEMIDLMEEYDLGEEWWWFYGDD